MDGDFNKFEQPINTKKTITKKSFFLLGNRFIRYNQIDFQV